MIPLSLDRDCLAYAETRILRGEGSATSWERPPLDEVIMRPDRAEVGYNETRITVIYHFANVEIRDKYLRKWGYKK